MRFAPVVLAAAALLLLDCATLDPIAAGTCGNGVVDPGEDCDTHAPAAFGGGVCGAPSAGASACHLACARASECPDGWGCSVTGICRAPSGSFDRLGEPVSAGVETFTVGDFDGDGRKDLIGSGPRGPDRSAKIRVHYFGEGGALAQVNALSAPAVTPFVHDFDGDGVDDFACGISQFGAFGIFSGKRDRSLVPVLFPSFRLPHIDVLPILVHATGKVPAPGGGDSAYLFAGIVEGPNGGRLDLLTSLGGAGAFYKPLSASRSGIVGEPQWASLRPAAPDSTCGEVVLALRPDGKNGTVEIYSPCRSTVGGLASAWASDRPPIVIPSPAPLEGGVHLTDVDGDGDLDVLFGTTGANGTIEVYAVRADGTGFGAPELTGLGDFPLASGDLDDDGIVDFVLPSGVALSRPGTPPDAGAPAGTLFRDHVVYGIGRRVRWTSARIANLNGDDHLDIAAASEEQPDIDFLSGAGNGAFSAATVATTGGVPRLTAGDFDGDGIRDLVFVQKRPGSADADLAIAYGRPAGVPEVSRVVGRTSSVLTFQPSGVVGSPLETLALFLREPGPSPDALPDLAVAIVVGNGDRQPLAPLVLSDGELTSGGVDPDPDVERQWSPVEVAAAAAVDPSRVDLVALAVGYRVSRTSQRIVAGPQPARVWVAASRGGTSFDTPAVVADVGELTAGTRNDVALDLRTATGDIDAPKDGLDEIVGVRPKPGGGGLLVQVVRPKSASLPIVVEGAAFRPEAPLRLVDVDGDGDLDVVTIAGFGDEDDAVVLYNDGAGSFVASPVRISLGEPASDVAQVTTRGAAVHEPGAARRELAVVTKTRLFLASPSASDRTKIDTRVVLGAGPLGAATGVAAGDFDGDGVDDLAIADGGSLRLLLQVPAR